MNNQDLHSAFVLILIKLIVIVSVQDVSRSSVCHSATVISNSYMHCGTTSDTFLRYASCCFLKNISPGLHVQCTCTVHVKIVM